jgi:hypothetical protein
VGAVAELIRCSCEFQAYCADGLPYDGYSKSH